jgi:hypothetical protein
MLIPRFTIRWLLGLTTFSAGVSFVLSYAVRGHAWAIGMAAGLWSLIIVALFYVAAFLAAWLIAQVLTAIGDAARGGAGSSPFAPTKPGDFSFASVSGPRQQAAESPPSMTG